MNDYESEAYGVGNAEVSSPTDSYSITGADGNQIEVVDFSRDYTGPRTTDGTPDPYGTGQGLNLSTDRIDYGDDPNQVLRDLRTIEARKMEGIFNRMLGPLNEQDTFNTYLNEFQRQQREQFNPNPVSRFAERVSTPIELGAGKISLGATPTGAAGLTYTQDLYPGDIERGIGSLFNSMLNSVGLR